MNQANYILSKDTKKEKSLEEAIRESYEKYGDRFPASYTERLKSHGVIEPTPKQVSYKSPQRVQPEQSQPIDLTEAIQQSYSQYGDKFPAQYVDRLQDRGIIENVLPRPSPEPLGVRIEAPSMGVDTNRTSVSPSSIVYASDIARLNAERLAAMEKLHGVTVKLQDVQADKRKERQLQRNNASNTVNVESEAAMLKLSPRYRQYRNDEKELLKEKERLEEQIELASRKIELLNGGDIKSGYDPVRSADRSFSGISAENPMEREIQLEPVVIPAETPEERAAKLGKLGTLLDPKFSLSNISNRADDFIPSFDTGSAIASIDGAMAKLDADGKGQIVPSGKRDTLEEELELLGQSGRMLGGDVNRAGVVLQQVPQEEPEDEQPKVDTSNFSDRAKTILSNYEAVRTGEREALAIRDDEGNVGMQYVPTVPETLPEQTEKPAKTVPKSDIPKLTDTPIDHLVMAAAGYELTERGWEQKNVRSDQGFLTAGPTGVGVVQIASASPKIEVVKGDGTSILGMPRSTPIDPTTEEGQIIQEIFARQAKTRFENRKQREYVDALRKGKVSIREALLEPRTRNVYIKGDGKGAWDEVFKTTASGRTIEKLKPQSSVFISEGVPKERAEQIKKYFEERGISLDEQIGSVKLGPVKYDDARFEATRSDSPSYEMGNLERFVTPELFRKTPDGRPLYADREGITETEALEAQVGDILRRVAQPPQEEQDSFYEFLNATDKSGKPLYGVPELNKDGKQVVKNGQKQWKVTPREDFVKQTKEFWEKENKVKVSDDTPFVIQYIDDKTGAIRFDVVTLDRLPILLQARAQTGDKIGTFVPVESLPFFDEKTQEKFKDFKMPDVSQTIQVLENNHYTMVREELKKMIDESGYGKIYPWMTTKKGLDTVIEASNQNVPLPEIVKGTEGQKKAPSIPVTAARLSLGSFASAAIAAPAVKASGDYINALGKSISDSFAGIRQEIFKSPIYQGFVNPEYTAYSQQQPVMTIPTAAPEDLKIPIPKIPFLTPEQQTQFNTAMVGREGGDSRETSVQSVLTAAGAPIANLGRFGGALIFNKSGEVTPTPILTKSGNVEGQILAFLERASPEKVNYVEDTFDRSVESVLNPAISQFERTPDGGFKLVDDAGKKYGKEAQDNLAALWSDIQKYPVYYITNIGANTATFLSGRWVFPLVYDAVKGAQKSAIVTKASSKLPGPLKAMAVSPKMAENLAKVITFAYTQDTPGKAGVKNTIKSSVEKSLLEQGMDKAAARKIADHLATTVTEDKLRKTINSKMEDALKASKEVTKDPRIQRYIMSSERTPINELKSSLTSSQIPRTPFKEISAADIRAPGFLRDFVTPSKSGPLNDWEKFLASDKKWSIPSIKPGEINVLRVDEQRNIYDMPKFETPKQVIDQFGPGASPPPEFYMPEFLANSLVRDPVSRTSYEAFERYAARSDVGGEPEFGRDVFEVLRRETPTGKARPTPESITDEFYQQSTKDDLLQSLDDMSPSERARYEKLLREDYVYKKENKTFEQILEEAMGERGIEFGPKSYHVDLIAQTDELVNKGKKRRLFMPKKPDQYDRSYVVQIRAKEVPDFIKALGIKSPDDYVHRIKFTRKPKKKFQKPEFAGIEHEITIVSDKPLKDLPKQYGKNALTTIRYNQFDPKSNKLLKLFPGLKVEIRDGQTQLTIPKGGMKKVLEAEIEDSPEVKKLQQAKEILKQRIKEHEGKVDKLKNEKVRGDKFKGVSIKRPKWRVKKERKEEEELVKELEKELKAIDKTIEEAKERNKLDYYLNKLSDLEKMTIDDRINESYIGNVLVAERAKEIRPTLLKYTLATKMQDNELGLNQINTILNPTGRSDINPKQFLKELENEGIIKRTGDFAERYYKLKNKSNPTEAELADLQRLEQSDRYNWTLNKESDAFTKLQKETISKLNEYNQFVEGGIRDIPKQRAPGRYFEKKRPPQSFGDYAGKSVYDERERLASLKNKKELTDAEKTELERLEKGLGPQKYDFSMLTKAVEEGKAVDYVGILDRYTDALRTKTGLTSQEFDDLIKAGEFAIPGRRYEAIDDMLFRYKTQQLKNKEGKLVPKGSVAKYQNLHKKWVKIKRDKRKYNSMVDELNAILAKPEKSELDLSDARRLGRILSDRVVDFNPKETEELAKEIEDYASDLARYSFNRALISPTEMYAGSIAHQARTKINELVSKQESNMNKIENIERQLQDLSDAEKLKRLDTGHVPGTQTQDEIPIPGRTEFKKGAKPGDSDFITPKQSKTDISRGRDQRSFVKRAEREEKLIDKKIDNLMDEQNKVLKELEETYGTHTYSKTDLNRDTQALYDELVDILGKQETPNISSFIRLTKGDQGTNRILVNLNGKWVGFGSVFKSKKTTDTFLKKYKDIFKKAPRRVEKHTSAERELEELGVTDITKPPTSAESTGIVDKIEGLIDVLEKRPREYFDEKTLEQLKLKDTLEKKKLGQSIEEKVAEEKQRLLNLRNKVLDARDKVLRERSDEIARQQDDFTFDSYSDAIPRREPDVDPAEYIGVIPKATRNEIDDTYKRVFSQDESQLKNRFFVEDVKSEVIDLAKEYGSNINRYDESVKALKKQKELESKRKELEKKINNTVSELTKLQEKTERIKSFELSNSEAAEIFTDRPVVNLGEKLPEETQKAVNLNLKLNALESKKMDVVEEAAKRYKKYLNSINNYNAAKLPLERFVAGHIKRQNVKQKLANNLEDIIEDSAMGFKTYDKSTVKKITNELTDLITGEYNEMDDYVKARNSLSPETKDAISYITSSTYKALPEPVRKRGMIDPDQLEMLFVSNWREHFQKTTLDIGAPPSLGKLRKLEHDVDIRDWENLELTHSGMKALVSEKYPNDWRIRTTQDLKHLRGKPPSEVIRLSGRPDELDDLVLKYAETDQGLTAFERNALEGKQGDRLQKLYSGLVKEAGERVDTVDKKKELANKVREYQRARDRLQETMRETADIRPVVTEGTKTVEYGKYPREIKFEEVKQALVTSYDQRIKEITDQMSRIPAANLQEADSIIDGNKHTFSQILNLQTRRASLEAANKELQQEIDEVKKTLDETEPFLSENRKEIVKEVKKKYAGKDVSDDLIQAEVDRVIFGRLGKAAIYESTILKFTGEEVAKGQKAVPFSIVNVFKGEELTPKPITEYIPRKEYLTAKKTRETLEEQLKAMTTVKGSDGKPRIIQEEDWNVFFPEKELDIRAVQDKIRTTENIMKSYESLPKGERFKRLIGQAATPITSKVKGDTKAFNDALDFSRELDKLKTRYSGDDVDLAKGIVNLVKKRQVFPGITQSREQITEFGFRPFVSTTKNRFVERLRERKFGSKLQKQVSKIEDYESQLKKLQQQEIKTRLIRPEPKKGKVKTKSGDIKEEYKISELTRPSKYEDVFGMQRKFEANKDKYVIEAVKVQDYKTGKKLELPINKKYADLEDVTKILTESGYKPESVIITKGIVKTSKQKPQSMILPPSKAKKVKAIKKKMEKIEQKKTLEEAKLDELLLKLEENTQRFARRGSRKVLPEKPRQLSPEEKSLRKELDRLYANLDDVKLALSKKATREDYLKRLDILSKIDETKAKLKIKDLEKKVKTAETKTQKRNYQTQLQTEEYNLANMRKRSITTEIEELKEKKAKAKSPKQKSELEKEIEANRKVLLQIEKEAPKKRPKGVKNTEEKEAAEIEKRRKAYLARLRKQTGIPKRKRKVVDVGITGSLGSGIGSRIFTNVDFIQEAEGSLMPGAPVSPRDTGPKVIPQQRPDLMKTPSGLAPQGKTSPSYGLGGQTGFGQKPKIDATIRITPRSKPWIDTVLKSAQKPWQLPETRVTPVPVTAQRSKQLSRQRQLEMGTVKPVQLLKYSYAQPPAFKPPKRVPRPAGPVLPPLFWWVPGRHKKKKRKDKKEKKKKMVWQVPDTPFGYWSPQEYAVQGQALFKKYAKVQPIDI